MIQVSKISCTSMFGKLAESGAKKLCGIGKCVCGYDCGHPNKSSRLPEIPKWLGMAACPLAKYNVTAEENPHPWWERDASEMEPSETELFAICACCSNTIVNFDSHVARDPYIAERVDLNACFGCPVKMAEDAMLEAAAESQRM